MGTNRRYAVQVADRAHAKFTAAQGPLQSLTAEELQLGQEPVTIPPEPIKAGAWVRFGAHPLHVTVKIVKWTERAIAITFDIGDDHYRCWVWRDAVR